MKQYKHNRLNSGELHSNDRRAVGFVSSWPQGGQWGEGEGQQGVGGERGEGEGQQGEGGSLTSKNRHSHHKYKSLNSFCQSHTCTLVN